jgi:peroxiredoxin
MAIKIGDKLPEMTLKAATPGGIEDVKTTDLFAGRRVVLFAVPGAFTPTCSAQHLPGFIDRADEIRSKGIDKIVCLSVNDPFVMDAWAKEKGAENRVVMLADGNGDFTKAMGLELDGSKFGMGLRSQRYAAVVEDGMVTALHVEEPMKFEVSSAASILATL